MFRTVIALFFAVIAFVIVGQAGQGQPPKSGPQKDDTVPGAFQPLNVNGPFAGRYHCPITEFRLNPVALVFIRGQQDGVDAEVKKLLEGLDKAADERHSETGLEACAVFLTPQARSSVSDDAQKGDANQARALVEETVAREKLVSSLKELSKSFKRLIVACGPAESI